MELDKDESASTNVFSRFDVVHQGPLTRTVLQDAARPLQGSIMPMAFELLLHDTAMLLRLPLVTEDDRMVLVLRTLSEIHGLFKPHAVLHAQQRKLCFTQRRCITRRHLFYVQLPLMWSVGRQSSRWRMRAVGMESRRRPFSFDLSWLWMMHPGAMLLSYCSSSILLRVSVSDSLTTTSSHLST